jgi:hypothetical protein
MATADEAIPTYEESVQQGARAGPATDAKEALGHDGAASLTQQMAGVRGQRISAIITSYIDPLLQSQAAAGLFRSTLVLVPSNTESLQSPTYVTYSSDVIEGSGDAISQNSEEAVIGFPSEDYVKLVRLHGDEYTAEFWRQPAVIAELDSTLKSRLAASGHKIAESAPSTPAPAPAPAPEPKRGFFRRKASDVKPPAPASPVSASDGTWRIQRPAALDPGHVRITIGIQDVSLRVVTQMGLYETRSGKAVVIKTEIGA